MRPGCLGDAAGQRLFFVLFVLALRLGESRLVSGLVKIARTAHGLCVRDMISAASGSGEDVIVRKKHFFPGFILAVKVQVITASLTGTAFYSEERRCKIARYASHPMHYERR